MSLYYDGDLSAKEVPVFEKHLADCEACHKEYEYFKTALLSLQGLPQIEAPPDILANLEHRIDKFEKRKSFFSNLFNNPFFRLAPQLATVFLVMVVGGIGYYSFTSLMKESPQNLSSESAPRIASLKLENSKTKTRASKKILMDKDVLLARKEPEAFKPKALRQVSSPASEENVEVVPCNQNPHYMNEEIEKIAGLSNGKIVRVSGSESHKQEILVRVPGSGYNLFMERLKKAMAMAQVERKNMLLAKSESLAGKSQSAFPEQAQVVSRTPIDTSLAGSLAKTRENSRPGLGVKGKGVASWGNRFPVQSVFVSVPDNKKAFKGDMNPQVIDSVMKKNLGYLKWCYERELNLDPGISGDIVLNFAIDSKGAVKDVHVGSSTVENANLENCVSRIITKIIFPGSGNKLQNVTYPFNFQSTGVINPDDGLRMRKVESTPIPEVKLIKVIYR